MKKYYVNKDLILGTIYRVGKSVSEFVKELGCSRVNFYCALNRIYTRPRSHIITRIANLLKLDEQLIWSEVE